MNQDVPRAPEDITKNHERRPLHGSEIEEDVPARKIQQKLAWNRDIGREYMQSMGTVLAQETGE
jgi:hypothetical protein